MPKGGGIPEKTADFHAYVNLVIPHLAQNRERLRIPQDEMDALQAELGEKQPGSTYPARSWNDLYQKRANPITNSGFIKHAVRAKRKKIDKMLRAIYGYALYSMTESDTAIIRRGRRKPSNSRHPAPDRAPLILIVRQYNCVLMLRFKDPAHPALRRNPEKFRNIFLEYEALLRKGQTVKGIVTTGRWHFRLKLEPKFYGKKIRLHARYYNRRGQGPWSSWVETIVI